MALEWADRVFRFFDSGQGYMRGRHGFDLTVGESSDAPSKVPLSFALGPEPEGRLQILALPVNSYIEVGWTGKRLFDDPGDDLFVREYSPAGDRAAVFVSTDRTDYYLLGYAEGGATTGFDLGTIAIDAVRSVKILSLNNAGFPGFELVNVRGNVKDADFMPPPPKRALIANTDTFSADVNETFEANLFANNGGGIDYSIGRLDFSVVNTGSFGVTGGTITLAANGDFTFVPNTDFKGTVTYAYTIEDSAGTRASADILLNVFSCGETLIGGGDADRIFGTQCRDSIDGRNGNDYIDGGQARDTLYGAAGDDRVLGGAGNDLILASTGADVLMGGRGNDTYRMAFEFNSHNQIFDNEGDRNVILAATGTGQIPTLWRPLNSDSLWIQYLNRGQQIITLEIVKHFAFEAVPTLKTTKGPIDLLGGLEIHQPADRSEALEGTPFDDTIHGYLGDTILGRAGDDVLLGNPGFSEAGADLFRGGSGNDTLDGGGGADRLFGGTGNDTYVARYVAGGRAEIRDTGGDRDRILVDDSVNAETSFRRAEGSDDLVVQWLFRSQLFTSFTIKDHYAGNAVERLRDDGVTTNLLKGLNFQQIFDGTDVLVGTRFGDRMTAAPTSSTLKGGAGDDTILGERAGDRLIGDGGNDSIDGFDGNDTLFGGQGDDSLNAHNGNDLVRGGAGDDVLIGGFGVDSLFGGTGNDSLSLSSRGMLIGGNGDDTLSGGAGDDDIRGNAGRDRLSGGRGHDTLSGGPGADTFVYFAAAQGSDRITDFDPARDRIDLEALEIGFGNVTLRSVGGGASTRVDVFGTQIVLEGVPLADVSEDVFVF